MYNKPESAEESCNWVWRKRVTSSGKKDYKEKHGMVICYVGYMWASDSIYFLVKSVNWEGHKIWRKQSICGGYFQTGSCQHLKILLMKQLNKICTIRGPL